MKWIKRLAFVMASLVALFVLALVLVPMFVDLDALANKYKDEALAGVGKQIGRSVTMGPFHVKLWSGFEASAVGLKIGPAASAPAGAPALLEVKEVYVNLALLRAVMSLGRSVHVEEVAVRGLTANVERAADCRMSFQDIVDTLANAPKQAEAPPEPMDPAVMERVRGAMLERVAIEGASVAFVDHAAGLPCPPPPVDAAHPAPAGAHDATLAIRDLNLEVRDIQLGAPLHATLSAAVLGAKKNLELSADTAPLPTTLPFPAGQPAVLRAHVKLDGIPLAPIAAYVPAGSPLVLGPSATTAVFGDLELGGLARGPADKLTVDGSLGLRALQLQATPEGKPGAKVEPIIGEAFDLTLRPKAAVTWDFTDVALTPLGIDLGPVTLAINAHAAGIGSPSLKVDGVKIDAQKLDVKKLSELLPMARAAVPPGAKIAGTLDLSLTADAALRQKGTPPAYAPEQANVKLTFDGDAMDLMLPHQLVKPPGTPLNLNVDASIDAGTLDVRALTAHLGAIALTAGGKISSYDAPNAVMDLDVKTNEFTVDSVARLLPAVRDALPPDAKLGGKGGLVATFKGNASKLDLDAKLRFDGVDVKVPAATVTGDATASFEVKGSPQDATITASVDLDSAAVSVPESLDKPAGTPLHFKMTGSKRGDALDLPSLELVLARTKITASAKGTLPSGPFSGSFDTGTLDLDALSQNVLSLRTALPPSMKGARVSLRGEGSGRSDDPKTQSARITKLDFTAGKSSLTATAGVDDPSEPRITFDLKSPNLDVDALFPPQPEPDPPPPPQPLVLPDIALRTVANGTVSIAHCVARKNVIDDLAVDAGFDRGKLDLRTLRMKIYGGTVSLGGTTADLRHAEPEFKLVAHADSLDAAELFAAQSSMGKSIEGRLSGAIDVTGKGQSWPPISKSLDGTLGGTILNGKLKGLDLAGGIAGPLTKALPMASKLTGGKVPANGETGFQKLEGHFTVKNGGLETTQPITADTPAGQLSVAGRIGLDQALGLHGTVQVAPALVTLASAGMLKPKGPVPVGLKIGGTITDPKIESVEVGDAAKALAGDQARQLVDDATAKARAAADAQAAAAKAQAEAAANAAKADAQKKAQAAADSAKKQAADAAAKAKKQAADAAAKAKQQAADQAKKAAGDARKSLGF